MTDLSQAMVPKADDPKPDKSQPKRFRWLKLGVRLLLYVPLVPLVLLALLVGTPVGSALSVRIANALVPGLAVEYRSGTLNGELQLGEGRWSMAGVDVSLTDLTLDWQPTCLLARRVCVNRLDASGIEVKVDTQALVSLEDDDAVAAPHTELQLPLAIELQKSALKQVRVEVNEMQFSAAELELGAYWDKQGIHARRLSSQGLKVLIPAKESDQASPQTANTEAAEQTEPALPEVILPMAIRLDSGEFSDSRLEIAGFEQRLDRVTLAAAVSGSKFSVYRLDLKAPDIDLAVDGQFTLTQAYPLQLKLRSELRHPHWLPLALTADANLDGDLQALQLTLQSAGDLALQLNGRMDLTHELLPFSATISEGHFGWPLANPDYRFNHTDLQLSGDLKNQQGRIKSELQLPGAEPLAFDSRLNHSAGKLSLSEFEADGAAGNLKLSGTLDYTRGLAWQSRVALSKLRPQALPAIPGMPLQGELNGKFASEGQLMDGHWRLALSEADVQGILNELPFSLSGAISASHNWQVEAGNFHLKALGAQLDLDGGLTNNWQFTGKLAVADAALLWPELDATLALDFNVTGERRDPVLDFGAQGSNLKYQSLRLAALTVEGQAHPFGGQRFELSAHGKDLDLGNMRQKQLQLQLQGDLQQQSLALLTEGDLAISAKAGNRYSAMNGNDRLEISQLNLGTPLGPWQLDRTLVFDWLQAKENGRLNPFCLSHAAGKLCLIDEGRFGAEGRFAVQFRGDPGQILAPLLPANLSWQGQASLDGRLGWTKGQKPSGELKLALPPGLLKLRRPKGQWLEFGYRALDLNASLDPRQLVATLGLQSEQLASLNADLRVNVSPDRALSGNISLTRVNLTAIKEFLPQLETLEGKLDSQLQLGGSLNDPEITGSIALTEGAVASSNNPTLLEEIQLLLTLEGQQADVTGQWKMGQGPANLKGKLAWDDGRFNGDLQLAGNNLAVIVPPLALLNVSPDLQIRFDARKVALTGQVQIPSGQITLVQLSEGGVPLSDDVVFEDSVSLGEQRSNPYAIEADLAIDLGRDVRIEGLGLMGRLGGNLRLRQQAFKPPLLFGNVGISNGFYKFMGQTLKIRQGELQFVGPPKLPNLDVDAIREIKEEELIAGVKITGTPARPVVTLFSNPVKEQAEILSYILKGKGFSNLGNTDTNALMMGAALTLGSQLGGSAIGNIGNTAASLMEEFGFSNVSLDTNDEGKVAISGYIGEDLMVKYGVGVFNPGYEMTVRYYLLRQLYLETVSGTLGQSLDIYYSFDL
ncbi:translocation/assembly module TamB domain-containing protein [Shewanella cyperi]|uniref:Translocation/assembly module TamB domain-containing protein n=1 Tax=Shewanella cyperi TaxID=2814292 RepID=A0A974XHM3_9GAMM|nr:translocation/assembly module TamB domain-containing protein [Shewanella cyperi]QSX28566.1 translocation/assembly module TamB domain-containing protein [Shewanella cyperi]